MLGASRTPAPQSTAPSTSTIPPHVGLSFGAQGSLFGAKRDSSSAVVSNSTLAAKGSLPSFQGLASPNVTAPKPGLGSAESASFGGTSSWLASSASVQQTPAGVKPNLFDFNKDQKAAASTSTPGGFFVACKLPFCYSEKNPSLSKVKACIVKRKLCWFTGLGFTKH